MDLEEHLTNNLVLIVPNNLKNRVIKYLNSLDKMYNLKIMSFDEVIKKLLFNYDTKTIFYVMKKNNKTCIIYLKINMKIKKLII